MKNFGWNFESDMILFEIVKDDIVWWIYYVLIFKCKINYGKVIWEFRIDVFICGWGVFLEGVFIGGRWLF